MNTDHYDDCIKQLYSMMIKLYGGYYEPRSERDANLAHQIYNLLDNQHAVFSTLRTAITPQNLKEF